MELLSFITFFLMVILIPTLFISLINPKLLKLDTRKKSIKIHLATASILFITFVTSALLSDDSDKNSSKAVEASTSDTAQKSMDVLNKNNEESTGRNENSFGDNEDLNDSDSIDSAISTKELSLEEFIDRINDIFDVNDVPLELQEVDEDHNGNLLTYKIESDDKEVSCSVFSNKINDKIMSMFCVVKHSMGDKDSEKIVADIVVSFVQTIFDVADRGKIEKVIPMFENARTIRSRAFIELGTLFEIKHNISSGENESTVMINIEPASRTDSLGNVVHLQFINVSR